MDDKLEALEKNYTWTVVTLPPRKQMVGCKWTYKLKHNQDGSIHRYKARLVVKGYTQQEEVYYTETFSPFKKMTIKAPPVVVSSRKWILHQLDVNNAFLHDDLFKEVYMVICHHIKSPKFTLVTNWLASFTSPSMDSSNMLGNGNQM